MIILHHLRVGRSIFTVWLLEEAGVEYQLKEYHRNEQGRAGADLQAVHPLGKSPVIEDGDLMLAESGAITAYILEKFQPESVYVPPRSDLKAWGEYTQWLHYPEGSVFLPLLNKMILSRSEQPHEMLERLRRF